MFQKIINGMVLINKRRNLIFLFLFQFNTIFAQNTGPVETSVSKIWANFLENDSTLFVSVKPSEPANRKGKDMAMYTIITGFIELREGKCSILSIAKVNDILKKIPDLYPNYKEIKGFSEKYVKLKQMNDICDAQLKRDLLINYLHETTDPILDNVQTVIEGKLDGLTQNGPCFDFNMMRKWMDNKGLQFTFELYFCDTLQLSEQYGVGMIGSKKVYDLIANEFIDKFLIDIYKKNGISREKCKDFIELDIIGEADGIPVKTALPFNFNLDVPAGLKYNYQFKTTSGATSSIVKYSKKIAYEIYSNEDLALTRASLPYKSFKSINLLKENQPRIIVQCHPINEIGYQYRKVTIIVYANNLFEGLAEEISKRINKG